MIIINAKLKIDANKREDYLKLMKELVKILEKKTVIYSIIITKM